MSTHALPVYPGVANPWWRRLWAWFVHPPTTDPKRTRRFYPVQRSALAERSTMAREMYRL